MSRRSSQHLRLRRVSVVPICGIEAFLATEERVQVGEKLEYCLRQSSQQEKKSRLVAEKLRDQARGRVCEGSGYGNRKSLWRVVSELLRFMKKPLVRASTFLLNFGHDALHQKSGRFE